MLPRALRLHCFVGMSPVFVLRNCSFPFWRFCQSRCRAHTKWNKCEVVIYLLMGWVRQYHSVHQLSTFSYLCAFSSCLLVCAVCVGVVSRSREDGVASGWEPPNMGAGCQTWVFRLLIVATILVLAPDGLPPALMASASCNEEVIQ